MNCPKCQHPSEVRQTSKGTVGVRRRRACAKCGERFSTVEVIVKSNDVFSGVGTLKLVKLSALNNVVKAIKELSASSFEAEVEPSLDQVPDNLDHDPPRSDG